MEQNEEVRSVLNASAEELEAVKGLEIDHSNQAALMEELGLSEDDVIRDEAGNVVEVIDRETGERFSILDSPDNTGKQNTNLNDSSFSFVNFLEEAGFDTNSVIIDDKEVPISDLTPEQQVQLLANLYQEAAQNPAPSNLQLNEVEQQVLDYLRSGGDLYSLSKQIYESNPVTQLLKLDNESLVRENLKQQYPEYSPEEIEEELNDLRNRNKIDREAKVIRTRLEKEVPTDGINLQANNGMSVEEYKQEVGNITNILKGFTQVDDFGINDDVRRVIFNDIVPPKYGEDSKLIKDLNSPQALIELSFWRNFGEQVLGQLKSQVNEAYLRGKEEVLRGLPDNKKFSGRNTVVGSPKSTPSQGDIDKYLEDSINKTSF